MLGIYVLQPLVPESGYGQIFLKVGSSDAKTKGA
jgi:hypothetical protein